MERYEKIGLIIKKHRIMNKLSRKELSEILSCNVSKISRIERGYYDIKNNQKYSSIRDKLCEIFEGFEDDLDDIFPKPNNVELARISISAIVFDYLYNKISVIKNNQTVDKNELDILYHEINYYSANIGSGDILRVYYNEIIQYV